MVRIRIVESAGLPRAVEAEGHARLGADGESAACATVSAALKAFGLAVVENDRCPVDGAIAESGSYHLVIGDCRDGEWLRGLWELTKRVLLEGQRAWPDEIEVAITKE